jgi:hypothetical protein
VSYPLVPFCKARFLSNTKGKDTLNGVADNGINSSLATQRPGKRFDVKYMPSENSFKNGKKRPAVTEPSRNVKALVGTNQNLEKPYLRLTTFPKAEDVRPLEVLIKALARIKSRYIQDEDFDWANEQLKSLRQDLTVQGLRNKFVLEVYETHARILLEQGDLSEFNQCQTMIRTLTSGICWTTSDNDGEIDVVDEGIDSKCRPSELDDLSKASLTQLDEAADEFAAYGLLYALVQHSNVPLELLWTLRILHKDENASLYKKQKRHAHHYNNGSKSSSCRHALQVVKAVVHNDYRAFFRLYESAPHLTAYLMDFLVKRVRDAAYERIVRAYRPTISVEYFREALHFPDLEETRRFLRDAGAVFVRENGEPLFWIDCKARK